MYTIVKVEFGQVVDYYFHACESVEDALVKLKFFYEQDCGYDYYISVTREILNVSD